MSWVLAFYRRPGEGDLLLEEVEPLFARLPRFTRAPPAAEGNAGEIAYEYENPISGVRFAFHFAPPAEEEEPEESDSGHLLTGLRLALPHDGAPEAAQEAIPAAVEVCQALHLETLDLQGDVETPARPDADALIGSYTRFIRDVAENLAGFEERRRRFAAIGLALLAAGVALFLVALWLAATGR
jgi:hypothetical protein